MMMIVCAVFTLIFSIENTALAFVDGCLSIWGNKNEGSTSIGYDHSGAVELPYASFCFGFSSSSLDSSLH